MALYKPTWGGRYFAEAVNVIPRGLWKNKPLVGVDYALARGFGERAWNTEARCGYYSKYRYRYDWSGGGQFWSFSGPMCAALLMSIWVAILARLDLTG